MRRIGRTPTINGVTSESQDYISACGEGLNAINVGPNDARLDGIDFISFNNFAGGTQVDVASALKGFANAVLTSHTDLRVDFGDKSIWAKPSSFVLRHDVGRARALGRLAAARQPARARHAARSP